METKSKNEKWDWIVGFRVDNRNFIGMISSKKSKMNEDIRHTMTTIAFAMVMVIILILILGIHFRLQIENGFQMFTRFFKTASSGYDPIDEKLLWFMEFIKLSRYANRMVDERRKKDKIIGKFTKQLQYANRKLKAMATVDGLTQVPNRRLFDETVVKEWGRAMRDGRPISLGMIDIDFFKVYNDTYGHQKGDECLKKVAKALGDAVKRPSDLLARYGGEEFSLLLPGTDTAGAITIAEIMKRNVADLALAHKGSKVSSQVTFSIGIATMIPLKGSSPESLISQADNALYTAKSRGRDRYEVFEQPV